MGNDTVESEALSLHVCNRCHSQRGSTAASANSLCSNAGTASPFSPCASAPCNCLFMGAAALAKPCTIITAQACAVCSPPPSHIRFACCPGPSLRWWNQSWWWPPNPTSTRHANRTPAEPSRVSTAGQVAGAIAGRVRAGEKVYLSAQGKLAVFVAARSLEVCQYCKSLV